MISLLNVYNTYMSTSRCPQNAHMEITFIFISNKIQMLMTAPMQFLLLYLTKHAFYKLRSFSYAINYRSIH